MNYIETEEVLNDWVSVMDGELSEEEFEERWHPRRPHGLCVGIVQEAYGDRIIYEDGYEEYYYIGD